MTARKDTHPRRDEEPAGPGIDPELADDLGPQAAIHAEAGTRESLGAEIEALKADAERSREAAARWQAEFENFRRRQAAAADEQAWRASERVVERLFPVIDNLERAIDHAVESATAGEEFDHLLRGVEMVQGQILDVLAKEGVEVLDPFGAAFDASIHQAVQQVADPDVPDETVTQVLQKGFRLHGKVLRPAMVVVSTGGPARPADGADA